MCFTRRGRTGMLVAVLDVDAAPPRSEPAVIERNRNSLLMTAVLGVLLFMTAFPSGVPAQATAAAGSVAAPPPAAATVPGADASDAPIEQARDLIKSGDYDRAIETLRQVITQERGSLPRLRVAYLQLIKTYVFLGNDYKLKPQGREASNLNYKAARELIADCLSVPALRHTQPEPASEYPPEMVGFFVEVRAKLFGSFGLGGVTPASAVVLLDGDTLRLLPGRDMRGEADLGLGRHVVVLRAAGYRDLTDEITISPNALLERRYALTRRRGAWWYAMRAGAVVGATSIALAARGHSKDTVEQPLPAAPPPPTQ